MSVALVVLAGGRATRLAGRVKPLLVRPDGRTLIEHVTATLAPHADETLIVAPAAIAPLFSGKVVEDPGEGPGPALLAASRATRCDRILLVAGDHVSPSAALAERLLSVREPAVVVSMDGILQPTFAVFSIRALAGIDPPPKSLRAILERIEPFVIDSHELDSEMLAAFDDVDTDEDVARHRLSTEGVPTWPHLAGETP